MHRLIAIAMLFAACAPMSGGGGGSTIALNGTNWIVTALGGKPPVAGSQVTLQFADGNASGSTGCNQYNGPVTIDGSALKFGNMIMTKRACAETERNAQESAYVGALSRVAAYSATEEKLALQDAAGATLAELARQR